MLSGCQVRVAFIGGYIRLLDIGYVTKIHK